MDVDLDKYEDDTLLVKFKIDVYTHEIEITGDPIPEERSTFEEF